MEAVVDRPGLLRHCLHLPPVALILQSGRVRLLPQTFLHLLVLLSDHFDALLEKLDIIPHQIVQTFNLFVSAAHVRVAIARCDALRDDALHVFRSHAGHKKMIFYKKLRIYTALQFLINFSFFRSKSFLFLVCVIL